MTPTQKKRADRIVAAFLQSRFWDEHRFGVSSDDAIRDGERYDRCVRAAEDGADGSTHAEVIEDMREAFRDYLHQTRKPFAEYRYRVEDLAMRHFDDLEAWHEKNGTLNEEVG